MTLKDKFTLDNPYLTYYLIGVPLMLIIIGIFISISILTAVPTGGKIVVYPTMFFLSLGGLAMLYGYIYIIIVSSGVVALQMSRGYASKKSKIVFGISVLVGLIWFSMSVFGFMPFYNKMMSV
ncbi:hypothetical protein N9J72_02125 [Candidatus Gracilibacteria bacterium]|nr:hypothetical protein [Candidatus Gracilibacteria bacterium]